MKESAFQPIPVDVARQLSEEYGHDILVIVAYSHECTQVHTTTFGKAPLDKHRAASLADQLAAHAGANLKSKVSYEDFRSRTTAEFAAYIDDQCQLIRKVLEKLANLRDGMVAEQMFQSAAQLRDAIDQLKLGLPPKLLRTPPPEPATEGT